MALIHGRCKGLFNNFAHPPGQKGGGFQSGVLPQQGLGALLGGGREEPLCEVEVELKAGSEEAAIAFAGKLAEQFGLVPEKFSKYRRALALANQKP